MSQCDKRNKEKNGERDNKDKEDKIRNNVEMLLRNMLPLSTPENDQLIALPPPSRGKAQTLAKTYQKRKS